MSATLVNIFGGPGAGKSTFAPGVVHCLKKYGFEAVFITEEAKHWALGGCPIGEGTQLEIMFRQFDAEQRYYSYDCFIVTDSPLENNAYYCYARTGKGDYRNVVSRIREQSGIDQLNFWLQMPPHYHAAGRYQTEDEARKMADDMFGYFSYLEPEPIPRDPSIFVQNYLIPHDSAKA